MAARYLDRFDRMQRMDFLLGVERTFQDRKNPFDRYSDDNFALRFRFTKVGVQVIFQSVPNEALVRRRIQGVHLSKEDQVLITLMYFGNNAFQRDCADIWELDTPFFSGHP